MKLPIQKNARGALRSALCSMLCVLTASAVLSACASAPADGHESASGDTPSASSAAPQATATPEPAPEIVPAGETAALGDWEITVNALTTQENYSMSDSEYNLLYYEPDEGDIYYVVNLSVKNLGKQSGQFLPSFRTSQNTAYLIYGGEYQYDPSDLLGAQDVLIGTSVNPLSTCTGNLVFSVPKDISGDFSLRVIKDGETRNMELPPPSAAPENSSSKTSSSASTSENDTPSGGNGVQYDPNGPTDQIQVSSEESLVTGDPLPSGETARIGPWEIRIDGHDTEAIPDYEMTRYHFFTMTITNTGNENLSVTPYAAGKDLQITLIQNEIQEFQPEESGEYNSLYDVTLAPGETLSGTLRFTVEDSVQMLFTVKAVCGDETVFLSTPSMF